MRISVFASGSSGNCTFIDAGTKILIDAGISYRRIKDSLNEFGYSFEDLDGIFISHEHEDHIRGLKIIKKNEDIPIYINKNTFDQLNCDKTSEIFFSDAINLDNLTIKPIEISHDAVNPYSFLISNGKKKIGSITDLGMINESIKDIINQLDCVVLESNHDVDMLLKGNYPYPLKQRILGPKGHLSNAESSLLVRQYSSEKLKIVFLAHLSENNNTPEIAMDTFCHINKELKIKTLMTYPKKHTELIKI